MYTTHGDIQQWLVQHTTTFHHGKGGGPKDAPHCETKTVEFDIEAAVLLLTELASQKFHSFLWSGRTYPTTKYMLPNQDLLNQHSAVLKILIALASNGYPDGFTLRSLLMRLEDLFKIFEDRRPSGNNNDDTHWEQMSLENRCMLAADQWKKCASTADSLQ